VALRRREEELRALLNAAPDAVVATDRLGTITRINPAAERIFGYSADELLGRNVSLLMPAPYRREHDGYIDRYLRTRDPHLIGSPRAVRALRKDGRVFAVELAVNEIDHSEMFVGVVRDISARKTLERHIVEAVAEEQRRIGRDIHDGVGQELTGLRYMARTLAESLDHAASAEAGTAARISDWLATLQRQLRGIIRQLVPVEVDEKGIVAALRGLAERTTETQDVTCAFECLQEIGVADSAVATQLYRIAQEAVRNAQQHAQASRITIQLSEFESGTLKLQVTDDGIGIGPLPLDQPGIGIRSMTYRAGLIGATLEVRNRDEGGTKVTCIVPRDNE
jgi:PAS domain S-box-containing protein